jgi:hypothetical protein
MEARVIEKKGSETVKNFINGSKIDDIIIVKMGK